MKTLLATDGSTYATASLLAASRLLTRTGNRFDVVCVVPEFYPDTNFKAAPEAKKAFRTKYYEYMERSAGQLLKRAQEVLQAEGVPSHVFAKTGSPGDVLVGIAEDYDVVVVGAQSSLDQPSPGLGPIASRIVEHVSGVALVGRELSTEGSFKILAAVDGSARSQNALEALMAHFNLDGAQITLMHVIEKPWLRLGLEEESFGELERRSYASDRPETERLFAAELRLEAEQIIENARRLFGASRTISTEARIEQGIPGNELLREAETGDYDLVVAGASGVSDVKHTLLGSVAYSLASYAPCSVAVVR